MATAVLLVDDEPLQRQGYRMLLDSQPDLTVIGEVGDGAQALAFVRRNRTDVVLMGIQLPRVNGLVASGRITADATVRELGAPPAIVLLATVDLDDHIPAAAEAGVFAILYTGTRPEALLEAVRAAAASRA